MYSGQLREMAPGPSLSVYPIPLILLWIIHFLSEVIQLQDILPAFSMKRQLP